jgi:NAD(P)-dependent dehydrogenase (short-subunit alcohol dehydrogenase family)
MSGKLAGRRIVITGASRGVGYETSKRFLLEGARVVGVARDEARLSAAAKELSTVGSGDFEPVVCDLGRAGEERRVFEAVKERWGALDMLVNNAAVMFNSDDAVGLLEEAESVLERTLEVNLMAPFRLVRVLLPLLEQSDDPRIINVSSGAGSFEAMRSKGLASYRLSKWALNGLTMLLAAQLERRIPVNAFDPGWVKTGMGGPAAPGSPTESAEGALALATLERSQTGKFWKDGNEIPY